jgi:hypothetical protein
LIVLLGIGFWIMKRKEKSDKGAEFVHEKDAMMEVKPVELPHWAKAHEMAG